jgi:hypothetical protein
MRLCICGSRAFKNLELVRAFVRKLRPETVIVSGAARGVDQAAEEAALASGHDVESWPVTAEDWQRDGKRAGMIRNELMIGGVPDRCTAPSQVDGLVAFWDGKSRGTKHAIELASRRGIWLRVYLEDGKSYLWPEMITAV